MARGIPTTCPVCTRTVAAHSGNERIYRHGTRSEVCPGSGRPVDLYRMERR